MFVQTYLDSDIDLQKEVKKFYGGVYSWDPCKVTTRSEEVLVKMGGRISSFVNSLRRCLLIEASNRHLTQTL